MLGVSVNNAIQDILAASNRCSLIGMLGWQDVRQRYRRSSLGPFWLTISMGIMIATIGIVFGQIFKAPMAEFLPFLAAGMIIWNFISSVVAEGCNSFISAEGIIKQLPIPLFVHVLRMIWRNMLILAHNLIILPLVFLAVMKSLHWVVLLAIPGFIVLIINLTWVSVILGVICARYRDLPQMVLSITQIIFYLTPIMWMPSYLPQRAGLYLLDFNPVYHFLQITRGPLLGIVPSSQSWLICSIFSVIGWVLALWIYGHYKRRIAFWI